MNRWLAIQRKSGVELAAEQRVLLRELRERGTQDVVYVANGFTGQTELVVPDDAHPSPESARLAEALAVLADPEAGAPPATLWEDHAPEGRRVKWLQAVDQALEAHMITTKERGRLYDAFVRAGRLRGWPGVAEGKGSPPTVRTRSGVEQKAGPAFPPSGSPPAEYEQRLAAWRAWCQSSSATWEEKLAAWRALGA